MLARAIFSFVLLKVAVLQNRFFGRDEKKNRVRNAENKTLILSYLLANNKIY